MPKRGNENAQMRREDYEALESSSKGGGGGDAVSQGFEKASEASLRKRRILSAKRPTGASPTSNDDNEASPSSTKKNPFANVNLVPAGGGGSTPKPNFSFGTTFDKKASETTTTATAGSTPFFPGGVSFGNASPAPTPAGGFTNFTFGATNATPAAAAAAAPATGTSSFLFGSSNTTTNNNNKSELCQKYQKNAKLLEDCFQSELSQYPIKSSVIINLLDQYLDSTHCLENMYWSEEKDTKQKTPAANTTTGATTQTAAAAATTTTPGGFSTAAASTPGSFFVNTPSSTFTTPGSTLAGAGDTPANNNNDEDEDATTAGAAGPPSVIPGNADEDWNDLQVFDNVHVYHYRNKEDKGGGTRFCSGSLKVQEHTKTKSRRMVMRDAHSGKVQLNLGIAKQMPIGGNVQKTRKSPQGVDYVVFKSVQDKEIGNEQFSIKRRVAAGQPSTLKDALTKLADF